MVGRDQWNTCVYSCKYYGTCTTYKSPDEEARNYHMQKKSEMFTVILAVVQLFLSGCNRRNLVALISETIWLVLIFMVLGNIEYEKENHKVA